MNDAVSARSRQGAVLDKVLTALITAVLVALVFWLTGAFERKLSERDYAAVAEKLADVPGFTAALLSREELRGPIGPVGRDGPAGPIGPEGGQGVQGPPGMTGLDDLPAGTLLPWIRQDDAQRPPDGWVLCDGTNPDAPNLANCVLVGWPSAYHQEGDLDLGDKGGWSIKSGPPDYAPDPNRDVVLVAFIMKVRG